MDTQVQQAGLLVQLSTKETRRLFETVLIQYDQGFKITGVRRKPSSVDVDVELEKGGKKTIKL